MSISLDLGTLVRRRLVTVDRTSREIDQVLRTEISRGIATSGRLGRSLCMGIADLVTVFAESAAVADAAATVMASIVDLPDSPRVIRAPASEIDANSDLGERHVVVDVLPISAEEEARALKAGVDLADRLLARATIQGAFLRVGSSAAALGSSTLAQGLGHLREGAQC